MIKEICYWWVLLSVSTAPVLGLVILQSFWTPEGAPGQSQRSVLCACWACLFVGGHPTEGYIHSPLAIAWLSIGGKASWSLAHPNILEIGILGCHISSGEASPELIADALLLLLWSGLVWHIEIPSKSTCHLAQDHTSIQKATRTLNSQNTDLVFIKEIQMNHPLPQRKKNVFLTWSLKNIFILLFFWMITYFFSNS